MSLICLFSTLLRVAVEAKYTCSICFDSIAAVSLIGCNSGRNLLVYLMQELHYWLNKAEAGRNWIICQYAASYPTPTYTVKSLKKVRVRRTRSASVHQHATDTFESAICQLASGFTPKILVPLWGDPGARGLSIYSVLACIVIPNMVSAGWQYIVYM